ncbi:citrate synthase [Ferroplasma sp.]|uniref:citrate synthase n=1 Tax=Ferroplasma sp. TaxID=2591003 RepID=UPI00307DB0C9
MEEISPGLENVYIKYTELTYIDGNNGIMRYRGYDINELAQKSSFEKVSYLMLFGKFPDEAELKAFKSSINKNLALPDYLKDILRSLPEKSDSLGILQTLLSAKASEEGNYKYDRENDIVKIPEILGNVLSMVANIYRLKSGNNIIDPEPGDSYAETFLKACFGSTDKDSIKSMDSALILYMDHEIPASTTAALVTASTLSDMYSSLAAAIAALRGPLHGGAAEGAYRQFLEIGSPENVNEWFKNNILSGNKRLVGFGHRVYRTYDPRLKTFKKYADILSKTEEQKNILEIARKLEEAGVNAFGKKGIYTNTDFYSGIVFNAMGFPVDMFTTLFGLSRISGILAHITEYVETQERLIRPRAIYRGEKERKYPE